MSRHLDDWDEPDEALAAFHRDPTAGGMPGQREIDEARADVEHLYDGHEERWGIGAPSKREAEQDERELAR